MLTTRGAEFIGSCYSTYAGDICPLADFTTVKDLVPATMSNGDIILKDLQGSEASFDVIGVVVASCLEAPLRFAK